MTFLTNGIQALQHQWKKCVDCLEDDVEEWTSFNPILRECLSQIMNFAVVLVDILRKSLKSMYQMSWKVLKDQRPTVWIFIVIW